MKTAIERRFDGLRAGIRLLAMVILAAGAREAYAGSATMSMGGGNNQSGYEYNELTTPLSVTFTGTGTVTVQWQVTKGTANFQASGTTTFTDSGLSEPGTDSSVRLDLGGTDGTVTVTATCTAGCSPASQQVVTFTETIVAPPPYLEMDVLSGGGQSGQPNTTLPQELTVVLIPTSQGYDGPFNEQLQWEVYSGSATFTANHSTTYLQDVVIPGPPAMGQTPASVSLDLGATPGPVTVFVTCPDCTVGTTRGFYLTVNQPAATLAKVSGDLQTGVVNSQSDAPLVVQLGKPGGTGSLSGQPINWSVLSGQATLSATTTQTDTNGQSQITFKYGSTAGPVTIEASSGSGKVDFTATAQTATAAIASGNNQTAAIGSTLMPFVVQIASSSGNAKGLSQVPVTWRVSSGSGTLSDATTYTDANGKASDTLTLGSIAGTVTVVATLPGNINLTFSATAIGSAGISVVGGNNQAAAAGSVLQPFVVQVASGGQALPGIEVSWSVLQGNGTLAAPVTVADASGQARNVLTLGSTPGINVVRAQIAGLGAISFTAVGSTVAAGNSQFSIVSGNNQALTPGQASKPLIVRLLTSAGQPVTGADVQWSISGQSGTLSATNTLTDASGQAQVTATAVLPGSYTVNAQIAGSPSIPALTFNLGNGVANLPSLGPTQTGIASVIDKACPALAALPPSSLTPAQKDLLNRCSEIVIAAGQHPGQVPNALNQLQNNKVLPQNQAATNVQLTQYGNLNTRLAELRQGATGINLSGLSFSEDGRSLPLAMLGDAFRKDPKEADNEVGKDFDRWGFFATGMIDRGGFDPVNNRPGFNFHNASLTAGVDYRFTDAFVAGVALGYNQAKSDLNQNAGKVNVDSYSVNGYFTWYHNNDYYVEGSVIFDWLDYDLSRNIVYQIASLSGDGSMTTVSQTASASPSGHQSSFALSLGKDLSFGAWSATPYVRGIYTHLSLGSFTESMSDPVGPGSGLATSVESRSLTSELAVLGGRLSYTRSYDWGVLVPNAVVEWNHEFRNDPQVVVTRLVADPTQTPFSISDQPPDQNYFNIGLGLNAVLPKGRSGFLLWEHLTGYSGAHENRYSLGIRVEF
ncbi:MAG TPA: autotransporter domain-containing protein [Rudaea sp.]|nr:autotransporter domain-containing protein [Rudaea sp.]